MYLCFCSIYQHKFDQKSNHRYPASALSLDNNLFETIPTKYAVERIIMTLSTTYMYIHILLACSRNALVA